MTATTAMPRPTRPFWSLDRAMAFLEEGLMVIHARHGKSNSVDTASRRSRKSSGERERNKGGKRETAPGRGTRSRLACAPCAAERPVWMSGKRRALSESRLHEALSGPAGGTACRSRRAARRGERLPAETIPLSSAKRLRRTSPDWRKRRGFRGWGPGTGRVRLFRTLRRSGRTWASLHRRPSWRWDRRCGSW